MYCLYIRKCQSCRNVKDCGATWERLGVGKKYQLMSHWLPLTELQPQWAAWVGDQSENKGNTDPWVRGNTLELQNCVNHRASKPGTIHCDFYLAFPFAVNHKGTCEACARTFRAQILQAVRCGE